MSITVPKLETMEIILFPNGVAEIAHNRPNRYNALSDQAYKDWLAAIRWAAKCDEVKVAVLTGRGKFYSSGQELQLLNLDSDDIAADLKKRLSVTANVVSEMITFPKLLIGAVNGTSIGFGTTTLALCDVVYSAPHAMFSTPFMKLAFCAEGCSSTLFPRIMGSSKANEMLLMGRTFSAQEMLECGFLSRIIPAEGFREKVLAFAGESAKFSVEAMKATKDLIRGFDREFLGSVNQMEINVLFDRMLSSDSLEAIMQFMEEAAAKKAAKMSKL